MSTSVQRLRGSKRRSFLKTDRERKKLSRKILKDMASSGDKSALEEIKKIKSQLHDRYLENKKLGKSKEYDRRKRRKKLLNLIDRQIKIDKKNINKSCVTWQRLKMTPLVAAIKQRDVEGVRVLLRMKASACIS